MKKVFKILGIIFLVLISISILSAIFSDGKTKQSPETTETTKQNSEKQYKEVFTFKGNGLKKSESFHLNGNDSKVVYKYNAGNPHSGMFSFYVVEKGHDIMKEGGFPDVMVDKIKDESESTLQKSEGDYYLNVNAVGDWEISVQEKQ